MTVDRRYVQPATTAEAVAAAAEHGPAARFVAGGTDLVVFARKRREPLPEVLISLYGLQSASGVEDRDGTARIGAGTTHAALERDADIGRSFAALADGAVLVGSPATRYAGTIGGNLCNASPAMDTGSPLLLFDAEVELESVDGRRTLALQDFFVGPGRTRLAAGELLTSVVLHLPDAARAGSAYLRLHYRDAMEIAIVGAAAFVALDDAGRVADMRVALTAVAPTCVLIPGVAEAVRGNEPGADTLQAAADLATAVASPIDDVRATAAYRGAMVSVLTRRALAVALARARGAVVTAPSSLAHAGVPRMNGDGG